MSNLFNSIFNDTTATTNPIQLFLSLLVSLILGLALTWAYKHRTLYTREFAVSLTLLPCLMTLVIFLVNGSLGTSIAVAGTFSLIRFRSATSGSRELIAIFLAMIIGLAAGTGYLALAILFTVFILAVWLLLEKQQQEQPPTSQTINYHNRQPRKSTSNYPIWTGTILYRVRPHLD